MANLQDHDASDIAVRETAHSHLCRSKLAENVIADYPSFLNQRTVRIDVIFDLGNDEHREAFNSTVINLFQADVQSCAP